MTGPSMSKKNRKTTISKYDDLTARFGEAAPEQAGHTLLGDGEKKYLTFQYRLYILLKTKLSQVDMLQNVGQIILFWRNTL